MWEALSSPWSYAASFTAAMSALFVGNHGGNRLRAR